MRVKVPKPARTFLEMDELVSLIDAASDQDTRRIESTGPPRGDSAAAVAARWARGMRPIDIARELGLRRPPSASTCAASTLIWVLRLGT